MYNFSLIERLPPIDRTALLIDFDGTLVDIAPRPDAVDVPPDLASSLLRLRGRLDDALAVISGRPIEQIEEYLPGVAFAVAGEHGAAVRHKPAGPVQRTTLPSPPSAWLEAARALVATLPGTSIEYKAHGFVLHYRQAPEFGQALRDGIAPLVATAPGDFTLLPARKCWEIKPAGVDKGSAVSFLMEQAPFAGRLPVFIGDDVTDEDGMRVARAHGGVGLRVQDVFGTPDRVRTWLAQAAGEAAGSWPV